MKNKILSPQYLFLFIFLLCLSPNIYGEGTSKNESIIHFEPGTLQVTEQKLDIILNSLDKSKKYIIQGYSCKEDKGTDVDRIASAEKRAEKIKKILIDHGFANENIITNAYDESSECKVIIIEIDEQ